MRVPVEMLEFPAAVAGAAEEVGGVVVTEDGESLFEFVLLDVAVGSEVLAGCIPRDQVVSGEQCEGSSIIVV
jgi:hypothetical protein